MKLLFVCIGNICRSPIAHGVMQNLVNKNSLDWEIDSAGTEAYHVGEPPHPDSIRVCKMNGIDISNQRARQFTAKDFAQYDIIYALATDVYKNIERQSKKPEQMEKVKLLLNEISPGTNKSVKDPWYGDYSDYEDVFEEINEVCEMIVERYK